jgi:hypothetical protein
MINPVNGRKGSLELIKPTLTLAGLFDIVRKVSKIKKRSALIGQCDQADLSGFVNWINRNTELSGRSRGGVVSRAKRAASLTDICAAKKDEDLARIQSFPIGLSFVVNPSRPNTSKLLTRFRRVWHMKLRALSGLPSKMENKAALMDTFVSMRFLSAAPPPKPSEPGVIHH